MASATTPAKPARAVQLSLELPISLELEHTRCERCRVWSRNPAKCPNCRSPKQARQDNTAKV